MLQRIPLVEAETIKIMSLKKRLVAVSSLFITFAFLSCQLQSNSHPRATIEGGNPPKFIVSGRGILDSITVSGPDMKRKTPEGETTYRDDYWVIVPKSGMDVQRLEALGAITYGQVPEGFVQQYPKSGQPAPLFEGGLFHFGLTIKKEGSAQSIFFTLHEGKIVTAKS